MAITAGRVTTDITISGATQSETTPSVMGRIDQIILESTIAQIIDFKLENLYGEVIYEKKGLNMGTEINDLRPNLLPLGPVTITISNPLTSSGTITVTFIEKERES